MSSKEVNANVASSAAGPGRVGRAAGSQDGRRGRSRSPSAYLRKTGKGLTGFLFGTSSRKQSSRNLSAPVVVTHHKQADLTSSTAKTSEKSIEPPPIWDNAGKIESDNSLPSSPSSFDDESVVYNVVMDDSSSPHRLAAVTEIAKKIAEPELMPETALETEPEAVANKAEQVTADIEASIAQSQIQSVISSNPVEPELKSPENLGTENVQVILLLTASNSRRFELLQLEFDPNNALVSDILQQVSAAATEEELRNQKYSGICSINGIELPIDLLLKNVITKRNEVMLAIPEGVTAPACAKMSTPILNDKNVRVMLGYSPVDAQSLSPTEEIQTVQPAVAATTPKTDPPNARELKRHISGKGTDEAFLKKAKSANEVPLEPAKEGAKASVKTAPNVKEKSSEPAKKVVKAPNVNKKPLKPAKKAPEVANQKAADVDQKPLESTKKESVVSGQKAADVNQKPLESAKKEPVVSDQEVADVNKKPLEPAKKESEVSGQKASDFNKKPLEPAKKEPEVSSQKVVDVNEKLLEDAKKEPKPSGQKSVDMNGKHSSDSKIAEILVGKADPVPSLAQGGPGASTWKVVSILLLMVAVIPLVLLQLRITSPLGPGDSLKAGQFRRACGITSLTKASFNGCNELSAEFDESGVLTVYNMGSMLSDKKAVIYRLMAEKKSGIGGELAVGSDGSLTIGGQHVVVEVPSQSNAVLSPWPFANPVKLYQPKKKGSNTVWRVAS